mmetsp:Transcript_62992/g.178994  ORF Transcript_62992/g.178994 Transcript_62992/m.178994 type:complete len:281 (-) Transcript_62992:238-1080(-)
MAAEGQRPSQPPRPPLSGLRDACALPGHVAHAVPAPGPPRLRPCQENPAYREASRGHSLRWAAGPGPGRPLPAREDAAGGCCGACPTGPEGRRCECCISIPPRGWLLDWGPTCSRRGALHAVDPVPLPGAGRGDGSPPEPARRKGQADSHPRARLRAQPVGRGLPARHQPWIRTHGQGCTPRSRAEHGHAEQEPRRHRQPLRPGPAAGAAGTCPVKVSDGRGGGCQSRRPGARGPGRRLRRLRARPAPGWLGAGQGAQGLRWCLTGGRPRGPSRLCERRL